MPHVRSAVSSAVDLMNLPSRVRGARSEPLPGDVALLLRLAAGDSDAEQQAAAITERPPEVNRRAAAFFIEQILLSPDADSYRILGGTSTTSSEEVCAARNRTRRPCAADCQRTSAMTRDLPVPGNPCKRKTSGVFNAR